MRLHFQDTQFPDVSGQDDVVFEPERDEYRCPQGPPRRRSAVKGTEGVVASCGEVAVCHACPVKAQYTTSQWLNTVPRSSLARWRDYGEEWAFVAPDLILMSRRPRIGSTAMHEVVNVPRWIVRGEAPRSWD